MDLEGMVVEEEVHVMSVARFKATQTMSAPAATGVVVLSDDVDYRQELVAELRNERVTAVAAALEATSLGRLEGWHAPWRSLADVALVVLDLTREPERGLALLDALRRRDWRLPVVVLLPTATGGPTARIGAHVIVEGHPQPGRLAAMIMSLVGDSDGDAAGGETC